MKRGRRYVLVSPCRDEEKYLSRTLESIMRQSVPPALWVVVDDGSTDGTPKILERYRAMVDYLRIIRRDNRGFRKVGGGVVDAFDEGLASFDLHDFDYVCKLDMDLDLPQGYFEGLIRKMEADEILGTCSGKPYFTDKKTGRRVNEVCGDEMSVGMTKFYRSDCFQEIGGFVKEVGWDIIDCHICRMKGWRARAFDDADLAFHHLRPMGSSYKSIWHGRVRHGYGQHYLGTHPLYLLATALYRLNKAPVVMGALAMVWGYFTAGFQGRPRHPDPAVQRFLRRYQMVALRVGKLRAAELVLAEVRSRKASQNAAGGQAHDRMAGAGMPQREMKGAAALPRDAGGDR